MTSLKMILRNKMYELFAIDLRSLAVLRMGMGLLIIIDLVMRSSDLREHYTDLGVFPRAAAMEFFRGPGWWSIHLLSGSMIYQTLLFFIAGLCAFALMVGYRATLMTFISWFLLASLQARNYLILNSWDVLLRMLLFWSIFLPLGGRWSVDSLLNPARRLLQKRIYSLASEVLLLQVAVMYFVAGFTKVNVVWLQGHALNVVFSSDNFSGAWGRYLLHWPGLLKIMSQIIPWFEIGGALLPFIPFFTKQLRGLLIVLFFLFHAAIAIFMQNLGLFPYVSMLAWIPFLPTSFWDKMMSSSSFIEEKVNKGIFNNLIIPGVVFLFFIDAVCINFQALQRIQFHNKSLTIVPSFMSWIGNATILHQKWHMFHMPASVNIWYVIPANLKDETTVDIFSGEKPLFLGESKIAAQKQILKNYRWEKFYANILDPDRRKYWRYLLNYSCQQWNASHPEEKQAKSLEVYLVTQSLSSGGQLNIRTARSPIIRKSCSEDSSAMQSKRMK